MQVPVDRNEKRVVSVGPGNPRSVAGLHRDDEL